MLRRIIFDVNEGDEAWLSKLKATGYSDDDIKEIYDFVVNHAQMYEHVFSNSHQGKVDRYNFNLSEQWYSRAWATQDGLPNIIRVNSGSSAGVPLADLLYSLAMSRILSNLRDGISGSRRKTCWHPKPGHLRALDFFLGPPHAPLNIYAPLLSKLTRASHL